MLLCSIDGCCKKSYQKGWCTTHYKRWHVYGDPLALFRTPNGAPVKWLDETFLKETDECILWPFPSKCGGTNNAGYGFLGAGKTAHRYICEKAHGPCPTGQEARHSCGKGLCCNKRHVAWATHVANEKDKIEHRTLTLGKRNGMYRLTAEGRAWIIATEGRLSQQKRADILGISQTLVWMVLDKHRKDQESEIV